MTNHVDHRLAAMHNALRECADFISDLRSDRDRKAILSADQEAVIKRLRAENAELKQMIAWMNTGKEDAA
jgi:cell division protein FtsB